MAEANTSTRTGNSKNPHFRHHDRVPYELGRLLREIPSRTHPPSSLDKETYQMTEAAAHHARNGINTLLWGLEAIGGMMVDLGDIGEHYNLSMSKTSALGDLIRHIAVELQFLQDTEAHMQEALDEQDQQITKEGK